MNAWDSDSSRFVQIIATIWSHYLKGSHVNWMVCLGRKENGNKWALCFLGQIFPSQQFLQSRAPTIKEVLVSGPVPSPFLSEIFLHPGGSWAISLAETKPRTECTERRFKTLLSLSFVWGPVGNTSYYKSENIFWLFKWIDWEAECMFNLLCHSLVYWAITSLNIWPSELFV